MRSNHHGAAMTPADRRITELIDKWLTSIDLHLGYTELSDAAYARAQSWPKHDRPTRWVLEVARQKIVELKSHCETRQAMQDARFAESLELMAFLANLVGIQHIQRFIPLAEPPKEDRVSNTATVEAPAITRPVRSASASEEATREMPRLKVTAPAPVAPALVPTRREPPPKAAPTNSAPAKKSTVKAAQAAEPQEPMTDLRSKIIADAVRLLKWGKPWHELAELIGRIADRPPVPDIRKVLRAHKSDIEAAAAKK
jgi:hypothetical protein